MLALLLCCRAATRRYGENALETHRHRSNLGSVLFKMPSVITCKHGDLDEALAPENGLACDACLEQILPGVAAWGCRACDFDVCQ